MDYSKYVGKYLEQDKIKSVSLLKEKTYKGKDMVEIVLENKNKKSYPLEVLDMLVSDNEKDATAVREDLIRPMVGEIVGILLERQIKICDIDYLFLKINESINLTIEMANDKLWGKDQYTKTIADVDKILTNKNK